MLTANTGVNLNLLYTSIYYNRTTFLVWSIFMRKKQSFKVLFLIFLAKIKATHNGTRIIFHFAGRETLR